MATSRDYAQMLGAVIHAVCAVTAAGGGGFMRHDPGANALVLQAPAFGVHDEATVAQYRVHLDTGGNAARVFLSREPYVTNDAQADPRFIQRFVRLFDTRNTVSVPLVLHDRAIGIFHAINKRGGDFTPADCAVLATVAPLLAACLQSALMFRAVEQERQQLQRATHAHERLLATTVAAPGPEALCQALHELVARPVLLLDSLRQPLASCAWTLAPAQIARTLRSGTVVDGRVVPLTVVDEDTPLAAVGIPVAGARGGYLVLDLGTGPRCHRQAYRRAGRDHRHRNIPLAFAGAAATAPARLLLNCSAPDLTKPARVTAHAANCRARSLADPRDRLAARCGAGRDTVHRHGTLIREALERTLGSLRQRARLLHWRAGFVIIASPDVAQRFAERSLGRRLQQALDQLDDLATPLTLAIGIGRLEHDPTALGAALESAEQTLAAIARLDVRGHALTFADLGVYRLFLGTNRPDEHAAFVRKFRPILRLTAVRFRHPRRLVQHVRPPHPPAPWAHPNTVKYRLQQPQRFGADGARRPASEIELALRLRALRAVGERGAALQCGWLAAYQNR